MEFLEEYWIPWTVSNAVAVLILIAAIRKTKLARLLFVLLFFWASWINFITSRNDPDSYLMYASVTPFGIYRDFINGWFTEHVTTIVTLISIGQGLIAAGMLLKGNLVRIAGIGAIVFFIAISPLGIGSGFPFPLLTAVAIYFILKKDDMNYLWKFNESKIT